MVCEGWEGNQSPIAMYPWGLSSTIDFSGINEITWNVLSEVGEKGTAKDLNQFPSARNIKFRGNQIGIVSPGYAALLPGLLESEESLLLSRKESLNSRMPLPRPRPSSGNFPGPKIMSAIIRINKR